MLKTRGTAASVQQLERISAALPGEQWPKWTVVEARHIASQRRHRWPPLRELATLLADRRRRLVRDARDLYDLVLAALTEVQTEVKEDHERFWNRRPGRDGLYSPKREVATTRQIAKILGRRLPQLSAGPFVDVEVRKGDEPDLLIVQPQPIDGPPPTVVIEAKGSQHVGADVREAQTMSPDRRQHQRAAQPEWGIEPAARGISQRAQTDQPQERDQEVEHVHQRELEGQRPFQSAGHASRQAALQRQPDGRPDGVGGQIDRAAVAMGTQS